MFVGYLDAWLGLAVEATEFRVRLAPNYGIRP